jgi:membrane-associated phospholipid phosphatase
MTRRLKLRGGCVLALSGLLSASTPLAAQTLRAPAQSPDAGSTLTRPQGILFGDVVSKTLEDFRRLPSFETFTWLGFGAVVALTGNAVDRRTSDGLSGKDALEGVFEVGELLGGAGAQFAGATTTYLVGRSTGRPGIAALGADLLRAQILTQTVTGAIKFGVKRGRPDGTEFSFPSGHSSVTFASATVLQRHFGWKIGFPAYAVAGYVATSRIQERRHFLSDVAFGAALGIVAGRTVTANLGDHRFAVAPLVTDGGGGVSFRLIH